MFTGLVSDVGTIRSVEARGELRRIRIACSYDPKTILLGASIACSGPCLTAVEIGEEGGRTFFDIDAAAETLAAAAAPCFRAISESGSRANWRRWHSTIASRSGMPASTEVLRSATAPAKSGPKPSVSARTPFTAPCASPLSIGKAVVKAW